MRKKNPSPTYSTSDHKRLIDRLSLAPSRDWIDSYLDLVQFLVTANGLTNGDPRLSTSIPISKKLELPVSINNRYVLAVQGSNDDISIGIIFGAEFERSTSIRKLVTDFGRFDTLPGEREKDLPFFLRIPSATMLLGTPDLRDGWLRVVFATVDRAKGTPYRDSHEPVVYEAAVNRGYRNEILDKAFPNG